MSIDITNKLAAVAEEFGMSKYLSKAERDAAVIQELVRIREELAAAQAREKAKTEVLEKLLSWIDDWCDTSPETGFDEIERLTDSVLDMPTDDTALRQAIKSAKEEMRERAAKLFDNGPYVGVLARNIAAAIQSLEVE